MKIRNTQRHSYTPVSNPYNKQLFNRLKACALFLMSRFSFRILALKVFDGLYV